MSKTIAIVVFGLAAIVLAALYAQERSEVHRQAARIGELNAQTKRQSAELENQRVLARTLSGETSKLAAKVSTARKHLMEAKANMQAPNRAPAANPAQTNLSAGNVFEDEARERRMSAVNLARVSYTDLVKRWGLSPEEADTFYQVVGDREAARMNAPDQDAATRAAARDRAERALRASLGDDLYAEFRDYESTLPARMNLQNLNNLLEAEDVPRLSGNQMETLVQMESQADLSEPPSAANDLDAFVQSRSAHYQRRVESFSNVLDPSQVAVFEMFNEERLAEEEAMFKEMHPPSP